MAFDPARYERVKKENCCSTLLLRETITLFAEQKM